jgi:hypothetical protein
MIINGKEAVGLRLNCSLREQGCPGFIDKDIMIYLLVSDELYIFGVCSECGTSGDLTVPLNELLLQVPTVGPVM